MKNSPIKFICTGMCGEDHPVNEHCKDCHHAEFVTVVTTDSGKKIKLWFNMLHGPCFKQIKKDVAAHYHPGSRNPMWKVVEKVAAFGERNCAKWRGKKLPNPTTKQGLIQ